MGHTLYWRYGEWPIRFNAGWPNFPAMGKAFGNFLTDGAGDEVMVEWAATLLRCRNLYIVEELYNALGQ